MVFFEQMSLLALFLEWSLNSIYFDFAPINVLTTALVPVGIFVMQSFVISPIKYGDFGSMNFGWIFGLLMLFVSQGCQMAFGALSDGLKGLAAQYI